MKKVLVLNGSPKKISDTMVITNSFLEGLNYNKEYDIKIINSIDVKVLPCRGCFNCLNSESGKCIIKDDNEKILELIKECDILIWSFPLYCYGVPSSLKAIMDRILPLNKMTMKEENGIIVHETVCDFKSKKFIVISGSGFPSFDDNFKAIKEQFKVFHRNKADIICISEAPLLNIKEASSVANILKENLIKAGKEYAINGSLSNETLKLIETPMIDKMMYMNMVNNINKRR